MTLGTTLIGLAQLSLVGTAAPELIRLAAAAGFDFIGARVRPVTPTERAFDLQPGTALLKQTLAAIEETGVGVKDIEFLLLDGGDQRAAWLSMMEAGQALGAETLTVAASDQDEARLEATLAQMVQDGADYGITPTLEVISYQAVNSLPHAARLAQATGCRIVADTLHLSRVGASPAELAEHGELVPMLQLCDGPAQRPADRAGLVHESRSERLAPGRGGFALAQLVAALPAERPLSVEAPSESTVARIGELGWAKELMAGARGVMARAQQLREQEIQAGAN